MLKINKILTLPIFLPLLLLQACGGEKSQPATVHHYGLSKPKYTEVAVPTNIEVQPGDTLFAVSKRYNIALRDLIDANGLKAPYGLEIGQKLKMPHVNSYVVQEGDTLYSISRTFNLSQQEIVALNRLKEPYALSNGQTLKMSADRQNKAVHLSSNAHPAPELEPNPKPQKIVKYVESSRKPEPESKKQTEIVAVPQAKAPVQVASYQPPARSNGKFMWPLKGKVVSLYGPKSEGLHNDGINIAAPKGAPVQSAENGVVAYVGNELKGFGNLLLIKHGDGYISAYGHLDGIQVKRGDQITKGQVVGTVGATGAVRNPQLHFELRKGTKAFDPMTMLGG